MNEHKNSVATIPVLPEMWVEGEGGGSARFGPAPRLLRTDCLSCVDPLKEDCWIPSPPMQKTPGPEAQTTLVQIQSPEQAL